MRVMAEQADQLSVALGVTREDDYSARVVKFDVELSDREKSVLGQLDVEDLETQFDQVLQEAGGAGTGETRLIRPTFLPLTLSRISQQNNILLQCIAAMATNIDGTGYEILRRDGEVMTDTDETNAKALYDFFDMVYPGQSLTTVRKEIRRDVETTGNGYMEVVEDSEDSIAFLRHLDTNLMYLVQLGRPEVVVKEMQRGDRTIKTDVVVRDRRYAQIAGVRKIYFREFGSARHLNRYTGKWESDEEPVAPEDRASQVIHFTAERDVTTGYGVPRWVNNIPAVLGSRKAEEVNLAYFESGGIPPFLLLVKGGQINAESRKMLDQFLAGPAEIKQRGAIVEMYSTTGSIDRDTEVKVDLERFGSERQDDALFQNYDKNSAEHVRMAFRLPPIFLGQPSDYNRATAVVSYMVAEAQVFKSERDEFDEIFNNTVLRSFTNDYVFRSKPVVLFSMEDRLKALNIIVSASAVERESLIEAVNDLIGLDLKPSEETEENAEGEGSFQNSGNSKGPAPDDPDEGEIVKMGDAFARHVITGRGSVADIHNAVAKMSDEGKARFAAGVGIGLLADVSASPPTGADFLLLSDEAQPPN